MTNMSKKHVSLFQLDYMIHCSENENDNGKIDHINMTYIDLDVERQIYTIQPFSYENHCKCYKKLSSRSWPVLFTPTNFFFLYTYSPLLPKNKKLLWLLFFLSNKNHRPLFNDIYYETILVWGLVSIWLTNLIYCLIHPVS